MFYVYIRPQRIINHLVACIFPSSQNRHVNNYSNAIKMRFFTAHHDVYRSIEVNNILFFNANSIAKRNLFLQN